MLTQKPILHTEEKANQKTELMDIFENLIETNSEDGKIVKRRNSFTGKNIFQEIKKEKELEKNQKIISQIKKEDKPEKEIIQSIESDKNSISSLKQDNSFNNKKIESHSPKSNAKSINIPGILKLKRDKSYMTLQNEDSKMKLKEKSSNVSFNPHRNFILKSELFKTDNSYNNPKENEKMEKNLLLLLTNKSDKQKENQFYQYFIGNNIEEKIDFKQNNENKKNIFSNTYIDNDEEEINEEKNKFKKMFTNFDDKSLNEKYSLQKNLISNATKKEGEVMVEKKLKEKVINILKSDNIHNKMENYKEFIPGKRNNTNKLIEQNKKNNNLIFPSEINNNKNLIQFSIQNNYINNNFNIQNPQNYSNLNQGYYYPFVHPNPYFNNTMNQNLYQNNNPTYFNSIINNNNTFSYPYNNNTYTYNNNINTIPSYINNQYLYNSNQVSDIDDIKLAKMSLNLVKNQIGCKLLQTRVQESSKFANDLLFPELKQNLSQICCDLSGNYLIQSLIDNLSFENLNIFLSLIQENLFEICLTENGSRTIQKLLEKIYIYPLLVNKLIFNLCKKDIGILFKSAYGNHLIQKYLTIIKEVELNNVIYNYIYKNFIDIAISKYGVCVIQKGLSEGNNIQRKKIIDIILLNLDRIIKDCYGNFIIQFIFFKFDKNKFNEILPVIEKIKENLVDYCTNRFSSSVIEKCFEKNEIIIGDMIINCLLDCHLNDIPIILLNSYGKYIIKKSFNFNNNIYRLKMMNAIIYNKEKIKQNIEGEKVLDNLKKEYPEFSLLLFQSGINY